MRNYLASLLVAVSASTAIAQDAVVVAFDGSFDDATFAVESAILDEGLVIDYISHVGEMLERTKTDVGGTKAIFKNADIFVFCSAVVSREVMEADPMNIAHCPYNIFVAENDSGVMIGYRSLPEGPMQKVQAMLAGIVERATEE